MPNIMSMCLTSAKRSSVTSQTSKPRVIRFEDRHEQDVFGGKGRTISNHNNQTLWHREIMRLKPEHLQIANMGGTDDPKTKMAEQIVDGVRQAGGEFYSKITGEGSGGIATFELMKQEIAIRKTMQKLRDKKVPKWKSKLSPRRSSCTSPAAAVSPEIGDKQEEPGGSSTGSTTNSSNSSIIVESLLSRTKSTQTSSSQQDQRAGEPDSHDSNSINYHQEGRTGNYNQADDFSFRELAHSSHDEINPSHPIVDPSLLAAASSNNDQFIIVDRSQFAQLLRSQEQQRQKMCLLISYFVKVKEIIESVTQSTDRFRQQFLESDILPKEALGRERQALEERYIEKERELENLKSKQNELEARCASQKQEIADLKARLHGSNDDSCSSSSSSRINEE